MICYSAVFVSSCVVRYALTFGNVRLLLWNDLDYLAIDQNWCVASKRKLWNHFLTSVVHIKTPQKVECTTVSVISVTDVKNKYVYEWTTFELHNLSPEGVLHKLCLCQRRKIVCHMIKTSMASTFYRCYHFPAQST